MEETESVSAFDGIVNMKRNAVVFAEGDSSAFVYIVKRGKIRVVKESSGQLISLALIKKHDFLGELTIFDDKPRSASAIVEEDCEVVMIKKTDLRKVLKTCPDWVHRILDTLSERLRDSNEILREHGISDDCEDGQITLTNERMNQLKDILNAYKSRRGKI